MPNEGKRGKRFSQGNNNSDSRPDKGVTRAKQGRSKVVVEAMVANVNNEISLKPSETDKSKQKKSAGKNVARKIEFKSPGPADKPKGANNNVAPEHKSAANKETNEFSQME